MTEDQNCSRRPDFSSGYGLPSLVCLMARSSIPLLQGVPPIRKIATTLAEDGSRLFVPLALLFALLPPEVCSLDLGTRDYVLPSHSCGNIGGMRSYLVQDDMRRYGKATILSVKFAVD